MRKPVLDTTSFVGATGAIKVVCHLLNKWMVYILTDNAYKQIKASFAVVG